MRPEGKTNQSGASGPPEGRTWGRFSLLFKLNLTIGISFLMRPRASRAWIAPMLFMVWSAGMVAAAGGGGRRDAPLAFDDVPSQTREFIGYYHSISLNRAQNELKERTLGSIPAPCCQNDSILTCCCPCNLAKSVWGLAHYAIAVLRYDENLLRRAVLDWMRAANPGGFTGDACYQGRCGRSFAANGCGGMNEGRLVF